MCIKVQLDYNIHFIDSISFIPQPLRDFPKTFALMELKKGYFSHKFNTSENQSFIGSYPEKADYGYSEMTSANKKVFDEWYATTTNKEFNFKQEMYQYCKSDVDILRRGCLQLRQLFLNISQIDPFQYITIAGVCMAIYKN